MSFLGQPLKALSKCIHSGNRVAVGFITFERDVKLTCRYHAFYLLMANFSIKAKTAVFERKCIPPAFCPVLQFLLSTPVNSVFILSNVAEHTVPLVPVPGKTDH